MYYVYKIKIDNKTRYIGFTQDITTREKQHNYLCFNQKKKKELYNNVRVFHPSVKRFELCMVKTFRTKIEAKRFECFLILHDYFTKKELWQRIPRITDV